MKALSFADKGLCDALKAHGFDAYAPKGSLGEDEIRRNADALLYTAKHLGDENLRTLLDFGTTVERLFIYDDCIDPIYPLKMATALALQGKDAETLLEKSGILRGDRKFRLEILSRSFNIGNILILNDEGGVSLLSGEEWFHMAKRDKGDDEFIASFLESFLRTGSAPLSLEKAANAI